jgi:hypothetical protein
MNAHSPLQANDPWAWIWSLGYRAIVPITPHDAQLKPGINFNPKSRGKAPGIRTSEGWTGLSGWPTHYPTESQTEAYRDMGAGIGIRCEKGLLGIDVDTLIEEHAERIRTIVDSRLGPLPLRIGQAPKFLLFCRTEPGYKHPNITFDGGEIEVRTSMQFVAVGTHPVTLQPYRWLRDLPPHTDLAFVKPEILDALWIELRDALPKGRFTSSIGEAAEVADQDSLRGTLRDVERAVALIPNDYASRKVYLRMGYALRAALPDNLEEARRIFQDWCARWDDPRGNDPETVDKDFNSFNGRRKVGIGWLRDEADLRTGGRFTAEKFNERIKPSGIDPTPYSFPDPSTIPVRSSLYAGHYMRKFLSATIAQSKVGKSTLVLAEALAMASGKPLLGVQPSGKFRVWWWNGEDPHEELERRVAAAMKFYKLTRDDIEDRLLINSGREMPIVLATQGPKGIIVESKTVDALCEAILKKQIDVFIGDPFVSLHKVSENDNIAIDTVGKTCALVAERTNIAFDAVHHSRKLNGMNALVEDGRGASALLGATRSMRALSKMSATEAAAAGIGPEYRTLFRFSDVSANMAPPSDEDQKWMQIVSVNLENGEGDAMDRVMKGDQVGVATQYRVAEGQAKKLAVTLTPSKEEDALARIGANEWRKDTRAANWAGVPIAQAMGFDLETDEGKASAKTVLKLWLQQGKLTEENRPDRYRNTRTYVVLGARTSADDLFG